MFRKFQLYLLQALVLGGLGTSTVTVVAQVDQPYIGEVRWFAGNFAPRNWALCEGQLLDIATNPALFSLLGTTYGGDGRTDFALPDLRGRGMVHEGTGPGLTFRRLGQKAGRETETLIEAHVAEHSHRLRANDTGGDSVLPDDRVLSSIGRLPVYDDAPADVDMHASSIAKTGGGQSHNNVQPSIALNCIIALTGVYPSRSNTYPVKPGGPSDPAAPITLPSLPRPGGN